MIGLRQVDGMALTSRCRVNQYEQPSRSRDEGELNEEQTIAEALDRFASNLSQEPGHLDPPNRLTSALGRLVYFMAELDSMFSEIIDNSLAGPDSPAIRLLYRGESTDWKFQKIKGLIEINHPDTGSGDVHLAKLLLKSRIPAISGYIKERNRVIHSVWHHPKQKNKPFEIWQEKRHREDLESTYSIDKLEKLCDNIEQEIKILAFVGDVYIYGRRPNLNEELATILAEVRGDNSSSPGDDTTL